MPSVAPQQLVRAFAFGGSITAVHWLVRTYFRVRLEDLGPRDVPLQPPDWVFSVAWTVLYVTTGVAWAIASEQEGADGLFVAITLLCAAWLPVYMGLRWKGLAAVILLASCVIAAFAAYAVAGPAGRLLVPLAAWLAFAFALNLQDVFLYRHPR